MVGRTNLSSISQYHHIYIYISLIFLLLYTSFLFGALFQFLELANHLLRNGLVIEEGKEGVWNEV